MLESQEANICCLKPVRSSRMRKLPQDVNMLDGLPMVAAQRIALT